jgi:Ca2+-binding RTX toxin-like protein
VGDALNFSAASATGSVVVSGGAGNDTLTGGAAIDTLTGNAGDDRLRGGGTHDVLSGGAGTDTFVYGAASDSTSIAFDSVIAANFSEDKFDVTVAITHIETPVSGSVSNTSAQIFDNNIASAVNATFGAGEAILLTANAGTLNGHKFLIIDLNGTAGYQAGGDLVIDVTASTGTLGISDFV